MKGSVASDSASVAVDHHAAFAAGLGQIGKIGVDHGAVRHLVLAVAVRGLGRGAIRRKGEAVESRAVRDCHFGLDGRVEGDGKVAGARFDRFIDSLGRARDLVKVAAVQLIADAAGLGKQREVAERGALDCISR